MLTHAAAQGSRHVSTTEKFCIVKNPKIVVLRFEKKVSPNVFESLTCVLNTKYRQILPGCGSWVFQETVVSRPISGHPEGAIPFFAIIFFSEGMGSKRVYTGRSKELACAGREPTL